MAAFEYKVVPAPKKGLKAKGVKGNEARFANALQSVMNELGADGWEYQRTDTLPCEERQGLTGKSTSFQNMLVFRRAIVAAVEEDTPAALIEDHSEDAVAEDVLAETPEPEPAPAEDQLEPPAPDHSEPSDEQLAAAREKLGDAPRTTLTMPWSARRKAKSDDPQVAAE